MHMGLDMSKGHLDHLGIYHSSYETEGPQNHMLLLIRWNLQFCVFISRVRIYGFFLNNSYFPFCNLIFPPGDVAGQFTAAPPTCPGDTFTFRCTVTGDRNGVTIWRVGGSSECIFSHSTPGATSMCGPGGVFKARIGTGFGPSFSSTLSGTATSTLDDTLVECFGPALSRDAGNRVGGSILQISGQFLLFLVT